MQVNPAIRDLWLAGIALLLVLLTTACHTTPKVDWDSRVGHYSFDQAVLELGPPDNTAKLSDGSTVAEWISRSGAGVGFSYGTGFGWRPGLMIDQQVTTSPGERVLRLVFGPDNELRSRTQK